MHHNSFYLGAGGIYLDQHSHSRYPPFLVRNPARPDCLFFPQGICPIQDTPLRSSRYECGSFSEIYLHLRRPADSSFIDQAACQLQGLAKTILTSREFFPGYVSVLSVRFPDYICIHVYTRRNMFSVCTDEKE